MKYEKHRCPHCKEEYYSIKQATGSETVRSYTVTLDADTSWAILEEVS